VPPTSQQTQPTEHITYGDPLAPEHRANPYLLYQRVREHDPIHRALDGTWVISRWVDGSAILRDPRFSGSPKWLREDDERAANNPIRQVGTALLMFLDPPDHTRLRSLVGKAFTPRRVEAMRPRVQELVDARIDRVIESGEMDVIGDLAYPLPVSVICELLGVPGGDHATFRAWSSDASRLLDGDTLDPETQQRGMLAGMQLFQYFTDLVEEHRLRAGTQCQPGPGEDLLSAMIAAEEAGDRLTHPELITTATLLFVAGHETTMNLIGNAVLALLRNPGELERLRNDPSLIRSGVEEFLRYDSPVQFTARIATTDLDVGGVPIGAGEQVAVVIGACNRDPDQFPDPDRLDLGRADNRHLSFAAGAHYCLGAALARLEAQVAIATLVRRLDHLELVTAEPEYRDHFVLRGVKELRVRFSPAPPSLR
jgi:cytochrome P450